jgi:hypothetical protein
MNKISEAYEQGVRAAMREAGLIKQADEAGSAAWPALFGALGGGLAAPEGKGLEAFGKTMGGGVLGSLGGAAAGGAGGAGLGALIALLSKGKINPRQGAAVGGMGGAGLGALGGNMYGNVKGYQHAIDS